MVNTNTIEGSFKHCKDLFNNNYGKEFGSIEKRFAFYSFEKECNFLGCSQLLGLLSEIGKYNFD